MNEMDALLAEINDYYELLYGPANRRREAEAERNNTAYREKHPTRNNRKPMYNYRPASVELVRTKSLNAAFPVTRTDCRDITWRVTDPYHLHLHAYNISHHNGDPYGNKYFTADATVTLLTIVRDQLREKALKRAAKNLESERLVEAKRQADLETEARLADMLKRSKERRA